MHEILEVENTENLLEKECYKIGKKMYTRKKIDISNYEPKILDVVFMMGGAGSRLLHITNDKYSKHMIQINDRPLSQYTFDLWRKNGFKRFLLLIDNTHRGKSIKEFYGDGSKFNVEIKYSVEERKLGSGGALKKAIEDGIISDSFVSHFPDDQIIGYDEFPIDFVRAVNFAFSNGYKIVLVCVPGARYPYGEVIDENNEVVDFIEKPFIKKDTSTGILAVHRDVFEDILKLDYSKEVKLERTILKDLARKGKTFKVLIPTEVWIPVNDEPNLRKFEEISQKLL